MILEVHIFNVTIKMRFKIELFKKGVEIQEVNLIGVLLILESLMHNKACNIFVKNLACQL